MGCEDLGKALRESNGLGKVSRRRLGLDKALREAAGDEGDRRARLDEEQLRAVVVAAEDAVDRSHLCEGLLCAQSDEEEVDIRRGRKGGARALAPAVAVVDLALAAARRPAPAVLVVGRLEEGAPRLDLHQPLLVVHRQGGGIRAARWRRGRSGGLQGEEAGGVLPPAVGVKSPAVGGQSPAEEDARSDARSERAGEGERAEVGILARSTHASTAPPARTQPDMSRPRRRPLVKASRLSSNVARSRSKTGAPSGSAARARSCEKSSEAEGSDGGALVDRYWPQSEWTSMRASLSASSSVAALSEAAARHAR